VRDLRGTEGHSEEAQDKPAALQGSPQKLVHEGFRCLNGAGVLTPSPPLVSFIQECFFEVFEMEVHNTIVENKLFARGDRVAIGASGGKDSTVLAHIMKVLNERYDYGLDLFLLSVDEGIKGYRDDSLEVFLLFSFLLFCSLCSRLNVV